MGTLGTALTAAQGALTADQAAIDITANNTANANTTGYTREVAQFEDTVTLGANGTAEPTGVAVTAQSQRDRVLQMKVDQQYQEQQATATRLTALDQLQEIFGSSGSSGTSGGAIESAMNGMFSAFTALEANATDGSTRAGVLAAAQTLAQSFNSAAGQIATQSSELDGQVGQTVAQVNALTSQIAQLNQQIMGADPNGDAGTLEDQRQQDIYQLSQYVGMNQIRTENNGLTLETTGGAVLVSEGQSYQLTTGEVNGVTDVFSSATGTAVDVTGGISGGTLGGLLTARDTDLPQTQSQLDALAYGLATQLNTVNEAGLDGNGKAGGAIFTLPATATAANPAGSAAGITVAMTDASQIAAASVSEGTGGSTNAQAMADVANADVAGGQTASNFYAALIAELGATVSSVTAANTAQQAALTALQQQNAAVSSVSLDEEASNLTEYERAYQAASQMFNVVDTVMTSALNLGVQTAVS